MSEPREISAPQDHAEWCACWNADRPLLPLAPADLAADDEALDVVRRMVVRAAGESVAAGAVRRHFAFAQPTRLALDLRVRECDRGRGHGGALLARLLDEARGLGATVVRAYAWDGDRAWDVLAARHGLTEVERDRFLVLDVPDDPAPPTLPTTDLERLGRAGERQAWELDERLHGALGTAAAHVATPFEQWRARALEAPGCAPAHALCTTDAEGRVAGISLLRVLPADPTVAYHLFTGVDERARGQGHARALKAAAACFAAEHGIRRLVADTSPANAAMLRANLAAGYRAVGDVRNLEGPIR